MPLTKDEAQGVARLFIRDYPGALELAYKFRENTTELYGPRAGEVPPGMKGGYIPKETAYAGRTYQGRVEVPLENMTDARDLLLTLRHEVLGHYGANTFAPGEKRALLDGLIAAREEPSLKPLWADIDDRYAGSSLDVRAEEVYSLHCEGVAPSHHVGTDQAQRGQQAFQETCLAPVRLMQADDLQSIACMVAQGLRDRTRTQQNFPTVNELFRKKENDMEPKKPFHETVAEKLIEKLKQGTAPWQKPWKAGDPGAVMPINPTTGKRYKGINAIHLMSQGHTDQRWMTYKQASAVDAQVRKGEKGTPIQYWKFSDEQTKLDASGKPVLDAKGEPIKQAVKLERPRVFFATVFNAEQIDGLPELQPRKQQNWNAVERAEQILQASGAVIRHGEQDRAFYRPATDSIHMPDKGQFQTADNYYAIALHELGHWTGHESRLDRDLSNPFGSQGYAKEELRAEIASMILGDELGIGHDPGQHAAYVGSWIKVLEDDPLEIFRAAADAEKIQDYMLSLEQKQVQEQVEVQTQSQHPDAFIDTNGMIRTWDTADRVATDWQGIVKKDAAFWYVGQEAGERSFTVLAASTLSEARTEAAIVKALAVDIGSVLNDPAYSFSHFIQAETLEGTLRGRGLTTIGNVTGSDPAKYFEKALTRLSPVFGIAPDHDEMGSSYLERKGLAQAFSVKAEQLISKIQQQNKPKERMQQPSVEGHTGRLVDGLEASGIMSRPEAIVTSAVRDLRSGAANTLAIDTAALNEATQKAFGFNLPTHWNGRVQVQGNIHEEIDGKQHVTQAESLGVKPEFWGVYAQQEDGTHQWLADFPAQHQADELAARLALVAAYAEVNEHERVAKLARINEERVRRDPSSTDEQKSNAKEDRKTAELAAIVNDPDMQRRVTDIERRYAGYGGLMPPPEALANEQGLPAQMTSEEFSEVATAVPLQDHGRRWEVFVGPQSFGFADAATVVGAVQEVHKREVNNALYSRSKDNTGIVDVQPMPPERVLSQYPELQTKFAEVVAQSVLAQSGVTGGETQRSAAPAARPESTFINVPFKEKDAAKALGAKWDRKEQSWYVPAGVDAGLFAKWAQGAGTAAVDAPNAQEATQGTAYGRNVAHEREYLAVPYGERIAAKAAGAEWDKAAKSWYAGPKADMELLARWKPENVPDQQGPAMTPQEEFADALRSIGCVVSGEHPIMDGKKHRISVEGEKPSEKAGSGFYVGHLDGHPAGYMKNNKTQIDMKWKSKGYTLDPEEKARLAAEAATKLQAREAEQAQAHETTAQRVSRQMADLVPVEQPTPYMQVKGIEPQAGVFTDREGQKTYIPATDVDGKQWSMQYIQEDGTKRFAKDSRKDGCFHVVGGMEALAQAPALVIGEGYATAGSLSQSLGFATVAAFDSGNLPAVAKALHQKYPDKPVIIAGDDDRHLELTQGVNPGKTKAQDAAKITGGKAILPIFAPGENSYPADLAPVTPEKFREHQRTGSTLSDQQLAALDQMKGKTDFNDLANKSMLGKEGIDRQVRAAVHDVIDKHQARIEQQQRIQRQDQPLQPRRAAKIA